MAGSLARTRSPRASAAKWVRKTSAAKRKYRNGRKNPRYGAAPKQVRGENKFAEGVIKAQSKWRKAWKPYYDVLLKLELPPRGPRNSPQNYERVRIIADALHAEKVRRQSKVHSPSERGR